MYDSGKVFIGLAVFITLILFPIWFNFGGAETLPNPQLPKDYKQCVESVDFMRSSHMKLLNQWRDEVVRSGKREFIEIAGQKHEKSLQNGCMKCHTSKVKFCDQCHNYAAVNPYCWDCHIQPKETN
jgi:hypothetical protein